jgi:hypothetical protein
MQGGEGPLPKGSVGASQRTLEPCRGKRRKSESQERTSGLQGTHELRGEKGDRNAGRIPCKAFHFALRFGKIGEELENYEFFAGLFLGNL